MRDLAVHESGETIDLAAPGPVGEALLLQMLAEREQRGKMREGELRCLSHGSPMYLRRSFGQIWACHWQGTGTGDHRVAVMSTEHRMQAEYVARAADRAGLSTAFEVPLPSRVRPDLVVGGSTAVEVQRSHLTVQQAKARTTKAIKGGMNLSLWLSDKEPKYSPQWMYRVPSATAFARNWLTMPPMGSATVTSGVRELVPEQCRPPTTMKCRETGARWCGRWHLVHRPLLGVSLDDLTVGVAEGRFLPAFVRGHIVLAREADVSRYDVAWVPPSEVKPRVQAQSDERAECRASSRVAEIVCCGEKPVGVAGEPLVLSCQLCPKSPTYWRHTS